MTSGTVGIFNFVLNALMALVLELAKCGFIFEALTNTTLNKIMRTIMISISLILIGASIFASSAYIQNQANRVKNMQLQSSTQFKQFEQSKSLQQEMYDLKKREIEELQALKLNQKATGEKILSTMPTNYTDKKNEQRAITTGQITDTQKIIDRKSTELTQIGLTLQAPMDISNLKINSENGYTSMFVKISEMINKTKSFKDNPISPETLEMWFYLLLMILFEFVMVITAYLAQIKGKLEQLKSDKTSNIPNESPNEILDTTELQPQNVLEVCSDNNPQLNKTYLNKNNLKIERVKNPESMVTTDSYKGLEIDKKDMKKYVDYMYATLKNENECRGYNSIGQYTGIGVDKARRIKAQLVRLGVIHTVGTKTYTQVDMKTCKAKLQTHC